MREPRTYAEYLRQSQKMQRRYIQEERKRYAKLEKLWQSYRAKASALGLHALSPEEIRARFDQLRTMEARVSETHGDSVTQRYHWEARVSERVTT